MGGAVVRGCTEKAVKLDREGGEFLRGVPWGVPKGLLGLSKAVRVLVRDSYTTTDSKMVQVVWAFSRLRQRYDNLATP